MRLGIAGKQGDRPRVFRVFIGMAILAAGACIIMLNGTVRTSLRELIQLGTDIVSMKISTKTVGDRANEILAQRPELKTIAEAANGKLKILVFKHERKVEVWAPGWETPRTYAMTAFSGTLGPKLREGDRQIPEGIYGIDYLNPNSNFHLSLKVSYPNADDQANAKKDGRTQLGNDIMIHGKNVTVGCIPVGDAAIEEIFYFASVVGRKNISVVISPYDMRNGRNTELEVCTLPWYASLCDRIEAALK